MTQEGVLTTAEVAELLKVHPKQVYRLMKQGLPAHRMGGEWRFSRADVLAWAEGKKPASAAPSPQASELSPPLLAANGDVVIEVLLSSMEERGALLGFVLSDKIRSQRYLQQNAVLLAGSHGEQIPARLEGERLARIHLVNREVGLVSAQPLKKLQELEHRSLASRPETAGVYHHLVSALQEAKLDAQSIQKRSRLYSSHRDVVCAVSRKEAEIGVATLAWASRLGLSFHPLATESYGLLVKARDLGDPRVVLLCEVAQSQRFQQRLKEVAGYNSKNAGDIRYD